MKREAIAEAKATSLARLRAQAKRAERANRRLARQLQKMKRPTDASRGGSEKRSQQGGPKSARKHDVEVCEAPRNSKRLCSSLLSASSSASSSSSPNLSAISPISSFPSSPPLTSMSDPLVSRQYSTNLEQHAHTWSAPSVSSVPSVTEREFGLPQHHFILSTDHDTASFSLSHTPNPISDCHHPSQQQVVPVTQKSLLSPRQPGHAPSSTFFPDSCSTADPGQFMFETMGAGASHVHDRRSPQMRDSPAPPLPPLPPLPPSPPLRSLSPSSNNTSLKMVRTSPLSSSRKQLLIKLLQRLKQQQQGGSLVGASVSAVAIANTQGMEEQQYASLQMSGRRLQGIMDHVHHLIHRPHSVAQDHNRPEAGLASSSLAGTVVNRGLAESDREQSKHDTRYLKQMQQEEMSALQGQLRLLLLKEPDLVRSVHAAPSTIAAASNGADSANTSFSAFSSMTQSDHGEEGKPGASLCSHSSSLVDQPRVGDTEAQRRSSTDIYSRIGQRLSRLSQKVQYLSQPTPELYLGLQEPPAPLLSSSLLPAIEVWKSDKSQSTAPISCASSDKGPEGHNKPDTLSSSPRYLRHLAGCTGIQSTRDDGRGSSSYDTYENSGGRAGGGDALTLPNMGDQHDASNSIDATPLGPEGAQSCFVSSSTSSVLSEPTRTSTNELSHHEEEKVYTILTHHPRVRSECVQSDILVPSAVDFFKPKTSTLPQSFDTNSSGAAKTGACVAGLHADDKILCVSGNSPTSHNTTNFVSTKAIASSAIMGTAFAHVSATRTANSAEAGADSRGCAINVTSDDDAKIAPSSLAATHATATATRGGGMVSLAADDLPPLTVQDLDHVSPKRTDNDGGRHCIASLVSEQSVTPDQQSLRRQGHALQINHAQSQGSLSTVQQSTPAFKSTPQSVPVPHSMKEFAASSVVLFPYRRAYINAEAGESGRLSGSDRPYVMNSPDALPPCSGSFPIIRNRSSIPAQVVAEQVFSNSVSSPTSYATGLSSSQSAVSLSPVSSGVTPAQPEYGRNTLQLLEKFMNIPKKNLESLS